ncbi:Hypothetical protein NTJ_09180 [Nesidiocoris tenuis]|uniref:Uncharacterized protein n=1 Tax=Nesidiocoris tenuis TaxID=355587 RepID=A0ABN7AVZ4_9HEMI|nr:Hypothetical protein NTJ_09180 [Nesidiocoris tenuis]
MPEQTFQQRKKHHFHSCQIRCLMAQSIAIIPLKVSAKPGQWERLGKGISAKNLLSTGFFSFGILTISIYTVRFSTTNGPSVVVRTSEAESHPRTDFKYCSILGPSANTSANSNNQETLFISCHLFSLFIPTVGRELSSNSTPSLSRLADVFCGVSGATIVLFESEE